MPRPPISLVLVAILGVGLVVWIAKGAFACSCALDEHWQLRRVSITENGKPVSNQGIEYQFDVLMQAAGDGQINLQVFERERSADPTYQAVYAPQK